jgi:hypothetical protein
LVRRPPRSIPAIFIPVGGRLLKAKLTNVMHCDAETQERHTASMLLLLLLLLLLLGRE